MCTAINKNRFFGRNLDWVEGFGEEVFLLERNAPIVFRHEKSPKTHPAVIGTAKVVDGLPLYFDGANEEGLAVAGLNFPSNAVYHSFKEGKVNVASFEFVLFVLSNAKSVTEAMTLLSCVNITNDSFSKELPPSPLHFIISDEKESITVEPTEEGVKIYRNPVEVLANNPEFPYHLTHLCDYLGVTANEAKNLFSKNLDLTPYSFGMGGIGLPGDMSSSSRFIRGAFIKENSSEESLSQFFHILSSVAQIKGAVKVGDKKEYSIYTSVFDRAQKKYYFKRYEWFDKVESYGF